MDTPKRPEIFLLFGDLCMGGIQTLIVRVANTFLATGGRCTVVCTGGVLVGDLHPDVPLILYTDGHDARDQLSARGRPADGAAPIVVTFDPPTCALALWLDGIGAFGRCKQLTGVFHPRAYFLDGEDRLRIAINRLVMDAMPANSIFFMNEECRKTHSAWSGRNFEKSPILPLGIEAKPARWQPPSGDGLKIVSVGRLVGFKAYNLGAVEITRQLLANGIDAQWHLFGSGELEADIRFRMAASGDDRSVFLHGDLPYSGFDDRVIEHHIFIGMGTAALEAAMLGMPVLMAVDGEEDATYGFLQELPFGNVGERLAQPPRERLADLLLKFHSAELREQVALGQAGRWVALHYDIDHYCARLLEAGAAAGKTARLRAWLVGTTYREATTGRTRRLANTIWWRLKGRNRRG